MMILLDQVSSLSLMAPYGGKAVGLYKLKMAGFPIPPTALIGPSYSYTPAALRKGLGAASLYAVRSSAMVEDSELASFAGMFKTKFVPFDAIPVAVQDVSRTTEAASTYARALGIRLGKHHPVIVQPLIPVKRAGVGFSVDISGSCDDLRIEWVKGIGTSLVDGTVSPDSFTQPRNQTTPRFFGLCRALDKLHTKFGPVDIEWGHPIAGNVRLIFFQMRPLSKAALENSRLGIAVGNHVVEGKVVRPPNEPTPGEDYILVAKFTEPRLIHLMLGAKAILTEIGGATSHAAIVARELGIPALIGASQVSRIQHGAYIRVNLEEKSIEYI